MIWVNECKEWLEIEKNVTIAGLNLRDHTSSSRNRNQSEKRRLKGKQNHSIHQVRKGKKDSYSSMPVLHAKDQAAFQGNRMHESRKTCSHLRPLAKTKMQPALLSSPSLVFL